MTSSTDWYQQALTPPDVIECRIRIGIIPSQDHVQVQVDLFDPMTSVQIAQWSRPHGVLATWPTMLDEGVQKALRYLGDAIDPF